MQKEMMMQTADIKEKVVPVKDMQDDEEYMEREVELEMPQARDGADTRERHGVRLELSVPRYHTIKGLLDARLEELKDDITSEEFFEVFDLANYIRTRAKGLKGIED
jgi:hypothetical protein